MHPSSKSSKPPGKCYSNSLNLNMDKPVASLTFSKEPLGKMGAGNAMVDAAIMNGNQKADMILNVVGPKGVVMKNKLTIKQPPSPILSPSQLADLCELEKTSSEKTYSTAALYNEKSVPKPAHSEERDKQELMATPVISQSVSKEEQPRKVRFLLIDKAKLEQQNQSDCSTKPPVAELYETTPSQMPDKEVRKHDRLVVVRKPRKFLLAKRQLQQNPVPEGKKQPMSDIPTRNSVSNGVPNPENIRSLQVEGPSSKLDTSFGDLAAKKNAQRIVLPFQGGPESKALSTNAMENTEKMTHKIEVQPHQKNSSKSRSKFKIASNDVNHHCFNNNDSDSVTKKPPFQKGSDIMPERVTHCPSAPLLNARLSKMSLEEKDVETSSSVSAEFRKKVSEHSKDNYCIGRCSQNQVIIAAKTVESDQFFSSKICNDYYAPTDPRKISHFKKQATSAPATIGGSTKTAQPSENIRDFDRPQSDVPTGILGNHEKNTLQKWPPFTQSLAAESSKERNNFGISKAILGQKVLQKYNDYKAPASSSHLYSNVSSTNFATEIVDDPKMLKNRKEASKFQDKHDEFFRMQKMNTQSNQNVQRKNEKITSKVEMSKGVSEEENQLPLEEFKVNFVSFEERNALGCHTFRKAKVNPKLFSVALKHFEEPFKPSKYPCPDNHEAKIRRSNILQQPSLESITENSCASSLQKFRTLKPDGLPEFQRAFSTCAQPDENIIEHSDDENDGESSNNATFILECYDENDRNTYDITTYEEYREDLQHRESKLIPSWACNPLELETSLFLQQPDLMNQIPYSRWVFPGKNL